MTRTFSALACALALGLTSAAFAQETPAPATAPPAAPAAAPTAVPVSEEEVVVVGQRLEDSIRSFVGDVSVSVRGTNQLARWDRKICPGISGLKSQFARPVLDRMAQRAYQIGLDVGEPGCKANILILVTPDADEVSKKVVEENRVALGWHAQRGQVTQGRDGLREFIASDAPVRWWHVAAVTTAAGGSAGDSHTGDASSVRVENVSRIHRDTRVDFNGAFIVVDAKRIAGLPLGALADYLSMVALAQISPDTDTTAFPSILNMFNGVIGGAPAHTTLSDWDMAYLRGLYIAKRDLTADSQRNDITGTMVRSLSR